MREKRVVRETDHGDRKYRVILSPGHPYADKDGFVYEHRLVVERAIGKPLAPRHHVHHVDGDGLNNAPNNLVICESIGYHNSLHRRERALVACGHAGWFSCPFCKEYDDPKNMKRRFTNRQEQYMHVRCFNAWRRHRYKEKPR